MADKNTSAPQSGKIDSDFKTQPVPEGSKPQDVNSSFMAHQAHPGPAMPKSMPAEEGTKEERMAKARELNK